MKSKNQEPPLVRIVDDDDGIRRALVRLVESIGYRVQAYSTPSELLNEDSPDDPACLLLDIQLPEMSGFELYDRLAARGGTAPVIFITGNPKPGTRSQAERADAVAYLEKPFDEAVLLDMLGKALEDAGRPSR